MLAKVSALPASAINRLGLSQEQVDALVYHPPPLTSSSASVTIGSSLQAPSSTPSVGQDAITMGEQGTLAFQLVPAFSSARPADLHQEPLFSYGIQLVLPGC